VDSLREKLVAATTNGRHQHLEEERRLQWCVSAVEAQREQPRCREVADGTAAE
jgi:hypothetical protein